ncbi:MAG: trigger factor [Pseudomonadales bacterium]|nr:trigger factor [Pseudomonadales bacterium]
MQVSIETMTGLERRMTIVVDSESFEQQIGDKLTDTSRKVKLPGFRAGKVPMREIRRRFGKAIRQEVAGDMMQSSFYEAIQTEKLIPAGSPSLDVVKMDTGGDLEFTATFEVYPVVELGNLEEVNISRPGATIETENIDQMLDNLREQRKTWEPIKRKAKKGNQLTIDFKGTLDGEEFAGGTGNDVNFVLGQGQMIADFDKALMGAKAGESYNFESTFPEDYQAEDLRGKTAVFDVQVKEASESVLPELDEEFVAILGVKAEPDSDEPLLQILRRDVEQNMQRELTGAINNQVKKQALDELARLHDFQIPRAMIERESENLRNEMLQQLAGYGQQAENLPQLPTEMFADEAEKRAKIGLIVNAVVEVAALKSDGDKVRQRIEDLAKSYADPEEVVNWYYNNEEQLTQIEMAVLEDQVIEHIVNSAQVTEVSSDYEAILRGDLLKELEASKADNNEADADLSTDEEGTADKSA